MRGPCASIILAVAAIVGMAGIARACPFCSAVSQTFTEEINTVQVGVIATLIEQPAAKADADEPLSPAAQVEKTKFEITQVLKGQEHIKDKKQIEVLYFGQQPKGTQFLILGIDPPEIAWNAPVPLTERDGFVFVASDRRFVPLEAHQYRTLRRIIEAACEIAGSHPAFHAPLDAAPA